MVLEKERKGGIVVAEEAMGGESEGMKEKVQRIGRSWGLGLRLVVAVVGVMVGGCAGVGENAPLKGVAMPREVTFWQPWLLYTNRAPYRALHVEVDCVEGTEPEGAWLEQVKRFLETQCDKPGGVTVRLDDRIGRAEAAESSSAALALRHIDGPPGGEAFMYVLYYDSGLNRKLKAANPQAIAFPYPCAVFVDRAYNQKGFGDNVGGEVLLHEIGHLVGTARSFTHGDGAHCRRKNCIMNEAFEYHPQRKWVSGKFTPQHEFCEDCLLDLERWRAQVPAAGLRFDGPLLVRREAAYQVYALPHAIHLHAGPAATAKREEVLAFLRAAAVGVGGPVDGVTVSGSAVGSEEEVGVGLAAAAMDPAGPVKSAAAALDRQIRKQKAASAPAAGVIPGLIPASPPS